MIGHRHDPYRLRGQGVKGQGHIDFVSKIGFRSLP
jgi:hypothetical protein